MIRYDINYYMHGEKQYTEQHKNTEHTNRKQNIEYKKKDKTNN